jgi:hypothetical protein
VDSFGYFSGVLTMSRIAIIHPEGNFNNNPNLLGLLLLLVREWEHVDLYAPKRVEIDQTTPHPRISITLTTMPMMFTCDAPVTMPSMALLDIHMSAADLAVCLPRPDVIIGIDRGIIEAAALAEVWGCALGLISYEILFEAETSRALKAPEIEACRNISFAVCQDRTRSSELASENKIPIEKIIDIPVAGSGVCRGDRSLRLKDALALPPETKVAVCMGEIAGLWSGVGEIVESCEHWPDGWVLVLHHRYGADGAPVLLRRIQKHRRNIFVSPFPALPFSQMGDLLFGADAGLAFYRPEVGHASAGRNLAVIGMASGKISTYLQHGVPIIINEIGEMSHHVRQHGLGAVVGSAAELPHLFSQMLRDPTLLSRERCWDFFSSHLDLSVRAEPLLRILRGFIKPGTSSTSLCEAEIIS